MNKIKKQSKLNNLLDRVNKRISLKILGLIMFIMSIVAIINYSILFYQIKFIHFGILNSVLGIIGFILIIKKKKTGLIFSMIWSSLQIISLQINSSIFSLIQGFDLSVSFSFLFDPFMMVKINFLALLLLYLFFRKRHEIRVA